MPTITYANPTRCTGGGHTALDVTLNGGATRRVAYTTDDVRAPLSELTNDERETLALLILKVHFSGKTRNQIINEFQAAGAGGVVVTI
jgi:hypothetical protein